MKKEYLDKLNKIYNEVFEYKSFLTWDTFGIEPKRTEKSKIEELEEENKELKNRIDLILDHLNLKSIEQPQKEVLKKKK